MKKNQKIILLLFLLSLVGFPAWSQESQEEINSYNDQGERHGPWKGYYEEEPSQLKYEGTFDNGEEIGVFKFYQPGLKQPVATKTFRPASDTVEVKYLAQNGKIISEGNMLGQDRIGTWTYYHKNSDKVMMVENYKKGKLQGEKLTYYDNGQIAEKAKYENGKLQGERMLYSVKGVVLEHLTYDNGELHGPAKFYNGKGELMSEGNYKRDKHSGIWKYYENGSLKEEKDFSGR